MANYSLSKLGVSHHLHNYLLISNNASHKPTYMHKMKSKTLPGGGGMKGIGGGMPDGGTGGGGIDEGALVAVGGTMECGGGGIGLGIEGTTMTHTYTS